MELAAVDIALFLLGTFVAALVAGLAGFAFGLIAAAIWLYVLTPLQVATLIVAFGLLVQGYAMWTLRRSLDWRRLWPFLLGAVFGVPVGVAILGWAEPAHMRAAIGAMLVAYSLYGLARPAMKPVAAGGAPADAGVGLLNGVVGGMSGLAGIVVTIWCGLRGWPKDQQRTVFQPVAVATFLLSAGWLGANGSVSAATLRLFLLGLPVLLAGTWIGLRLYGHVDEAQFRKLVLALLLLSGAMLLVSPR